MYCGRCGAKNDDSAAFCTSCGANLGADERTVEIRQDFGQGQNQSYGQNPGYGQNPVYGQAQGQGYGQDSTVYVNPGYARNGGGYGQNGSGYSQNSAYGQNSAGYQSFQNWAQSEAQGKEKKSKKKLFIGIGTVAVVAAAVVAAVFIFGGKSPAGSAKGYKSYEELADAYCEAMFQQDSDKIIGMVPDVMMEYYASISDMSVSQVRRELSDTMDDIFDEYGYDLPRAKYSSVEMDYEQRVSRSDIRESNETVEDEIGKSPEFTDGYDLELVVYYRLNGEKLYFESGFSAVEIDGKWYLMDPTTIEDMVESFYWSY